MSDTIFDKIVRGEMENYTIWEDAEHLAFLTPFPNTPGATVVIPKTNYGDNAFAMEEAHFLALMAATKTVANLLETSLNVSRVALVFEGTGVAYVHAKLYPLHGALASQTDVWSNEPEFTETYRGFITTHEGLPMEKERLTAIQAQILASNDNVFVSKA